MAAERDLTEAEAQRLARLDFRYRNASNAAQSFKALDRLEKTEDRLVRSGVPVDQILKARGL